LREGETSRAHKKRAGKPAASDEQGQPTERQFSPRKDDHYKERDVISDNPGKKVQLLYDPCPVILGFHEETVCSKNRGAGDYDKGR